MAFAPVQSITQVTTSGLTEFSMTLSPTVQNNLVVVHIRLNSTGQSVLSVRDDKGNPYVILGPLDNTRRAYQAYAVQIFGGTTTITVSLSAADNSRAGVDEYSGGDIRNSFIYDTHQTGTGTSASLSVPSFSPASTGELIVTTAAIDGGRTFTAGTDYTLYSYPGTTTTLASQYRLSCAASETSPMSISSLERFMLIATAFKPAPTAPTVTTDSITSYGWGHALAGGNVTAGVNLIERGVCYNTSTNPTTSNNKVVDSATSTGTFSVTITGLSANTTYYVRAYAINGGGTSYGSNVSFTTTAAQSITGLSSITGISTITL